MMLLRSQSMKLIQQSMLVVKSLVLKLILTKLTYYLLHSNGTTDIQYISSGNVNPGSFGVALGSWSTVLSSECLEVIESNTSVDVSRLF